MTGDLRRIIAALCILALGGCGVNPVTGKPQALMTSEKGEAEMGKAAAAQVAASMGLVDLPANHRLDR